MSVLCRVLRVPRVVFWGWGNLHIFLVKLLETSRAEFTALLFFSFEIEQTRISFWFLSWGYSSFFTVYLHSSQYLLWSLLGFRLVLVIVWTLTSRPLVSCHSVSASLHLSFFDRCYKSLVLSLCLLLFEFGKFIEKSQGYSVALDTCSWGYFW